MNAEEALKRADENLRKKSYEIEPLLSSEVTRFDKQIEKEVSVGNYSTKFQLDCYPGHSTPMLTGFLKRVEHRKFRIDTALFVPDRYLLVGWGRPEMSLDYRHDW